LPIYIILAVLLMASGWIGLIFSVYVAIHSRISTVGVISALIRLCIFVVGAWLVAAFI
jgi:hypothetical protein